MVIICNHRTIAEGVIQTTHKTLERLHNYITELKCNDCVWLLAGRKDAGEVIVTKSVEVLKHALCLDWIIELKGVEDQEVCIQEFETYKDAYRAAYQLKKPPRKRAVTKKRKPKTHFTN